MATRGGGAQAWLRAPARNDVKLFAHGRRTLRRRVYSGRLGAAAVAQTLGDHVPAGARGARSGGAGAPAARAHAADPGARGGEPGLVPPARRRPRRRSRAPGRLGPVALPHQGRAARCLSLHARLRWRGGLSPRPHVERHHRQPDPEPVHRRRRRAVGRGDGPLLRGGGRHPGRRDPDHPVVRPVHRRLRLPLRCRAPGRDDRADRRRPHRAAAPAHARPRRHRAAGDRDLSAAADRGGPRRGVRPRLAATPRRHPRLRDVVGRAARRGSSASSRCRRSTSSA